MRVWVLPDDIEGDDLASLLRSYGGRAIVLPAEVPYEQERVQDLDRAMRRRPGSMAPWEQDIRRALRIQIAVRGWVEVTE